MINTYFWIIGWLSFSGMLGEVQGASSVTGELSVHRAVYVQVESSTACEGELHAWYALHVSPSGQSDADSTHLSAVHVIDSTVECSSQPDVHLSRVLPIEAESSGSSSVSGRITINQVDIYDLLVSGACSVSGDINRLFKLVAEISAASQVDGEFQLERSPEVTVETLSSVSAELNAYYSVDSGIDCSSDVSAHITVNPVEIDADLECSSGLSADLSVYFALGSDVSGSTSINAQPDVTHTLRMSGESFPSSTVSANLNKWGAGYSVVQDKSVVSGYLNVQWALWSLLTTAPLSNTRLDVHLSVRYETSVSIVNLKSTVSGWVATRFGVTSGIDQNASVVFADKMTLNPVWFTGLLVQGETSLDTDMHANRMVASGVSGSSSLDVWMNRYGACWSQVTGNSVCSAYLNRYAACWTDLNSQSQVTGTLNVHRAIQSEVSGSTSLSLDYSRMRNLYGECSDNSTTMTGKVTMNPAWIVDAVSECSSSVTGELNRKFAVEGSSGGDTSMQADSYRMRNLETLIEASSSVSASLNAAFAVRSTVQPNTQINVHLSRRFYLPDVAVTGITSATAYLSAIRPISASVPDCRTTIDANAYRKRNAVPDLIYGYSVVSGHLTINAVDMDGEVPNGATQVDAELKVGKMVETTVSGYSDVSAYINVHYGLWTVPQCSTLVDSGLNAWFACRSQPEASTDVQAHLSRRFYLPDKTIDGLSQVSADIGVKRAVLSGIDGCASDLDVVLNVRRSILSDVVNSHSSVTGLLRKNIRSVEATVPGCSCLVGATLNIKMGVAGECSGVTDVDCTAYRKRNLEVVVQTETEPSSHLSRRFYFDWTTLDGQSSLSVYLSAIRQITASIAGVTSIDCTAYRKRNVVSDTVAGYSLVSGHVTVNPVEIDGDSSGSTHLIGTLSLFASVQTDATGGSLIEGTLNAERSIKSDIVGTSSVQATLNAERAIGSDIQCSDDASAYLNAWYSCNCLCDDNDTTLTADLSRHIAVWSIVSGQSVVTGNLTLNAKAMDASSAGYSGVTGELDTAKYLYADIAGDTVVDATAYRIVTLSATVVGSTQVSASLYSVGYLSSSVSGSSEVSGQLKFVANLSASVGGYSYVFGSTGEDLSIYGSSAGRSIVTGYLNLKGELFGGDPDGVVAVAGGAYLLTLVSDDGSHGLPDWLRADRVEESTLGGLVESIRLHVSEMLVSELSAIGMSLKQHVAVWSAPMQEKPRKVSLVTLSGSRMLLREASSMHDLVHSPLPRWYWQDGQLMVAHVDGAMELVQPDGDLFRLARAVQIDRNRPVYLLWSRSRGDIAYLLSDEELNFENGRLASVSRFGYIIHARDLQFGADYGTYQVSAKANVWLTFQTSSGGDTVPECAPLQVTLNRRGFVSVQMHEDNAMFWAARGLQVNHPAEGSLSGCYGERGRLVGVFVGSSAPSTVPSAAPTGNYTPEIGQVFIIEPDARYVVPSGATRLMIGFLNDTGYRFGTGGAVITVVQYEPDGLLSVVYTDSQLTAHEVNVVADEQPVTLRAVTLPSNRFAMWSRMLGNPLRMFGWNGHDILPGLMAVGVRKPVLPGIKPVWYEWDGINSITVSGMDVDVPGLPRWFTFRGRLESSRLPYYPSGRVLVDGVWGDAVAGANVEMLVPLWSGQVSGNSITVIPSRNMMPGARYLVAALPYRVQTIEPVVVRQGNGNRLFQWSAEVT
ncbi:MAG: hypothetical protein KatS3mg023_3728 [Armatimonadota bacterium]|nr:MAG: hypothetical protein KatS3mg023_3728 [Armatimonadota bacterium]